jgi:hypothetical protein
MRLRNGWQHEGPSDQGPIALGTGNHPYAKRSMSRSFARPTRTSEAPYPAPCIPAAPRDLPRGQRHTLQWLGWIQLVSEERNLSAVSTSRSRQYTGDRTTSTEFDSEKQVQMRRISGRRITAKSRALWGFARYMHVLQSVA